MTFEHCTKQLALLAVTLRADVDEPQFRAYYRALQDVPEPLFARAVEAAMASCTFFPKPVELRALAERERQAVLALHPYVACSECAGQRGWRAVLLNGVARVERCPCRANWLKRLEALGVSSQPLLTAAPDAQAVVTP